MKEKKSELTKCCKCNGANVCNDCYKVYAEKQFKHMWNNGGGYMNSLCDTITKADYNNLELLYKAYPILVDGYCMYSQGHLFNER